MRRIRPYLSRDGAPILYQVIEFVQGARTVLITKNEAEARATYDGLKHGTLVYVEGRDEQGRPVPGVMMNNTFLARRLNGVEQLEK